MRRFIRAVQWIIVKIARAVVKRGDCGDEFFIDIFQGQDGKWYIRIIDDTGDILFRSTDGFPSRWQAETKATLFMLNPPNEIRVLDAYLDKRKEV